MFYQYYIVAAELCPFRAVDTERIFVETSCSVFRIMLLFKKLKVRKLERRSK
jgi:hypothetical protein